MLIEYVGRAGRRVVGEWEWMGKGTVEEVGDVEVAAGLLTCPGPEFEVGDGEPLLGIEGIGKVTAVALAVEGVGSVGDLAGLDEVGVARLTRELRVSKARVLKWVEQARVLVGPASSVSSMDGEEE